MLQQKEPVDFMVGTGQTWSVRQLCETAFGVAGLDYNDHVVIDERFLRPAEVELLVADPSRARHELGWTPRVGFHQLVSMMVEADLERHRSAR